MVQVGLGIQVTQWVTPAYPGLSRGAEGNLGSAGSLVSNIRNLSYSPNLIHHGTVVLVVPVVRAVPWDQAGLPVQSGQVNPSFLDPPETPEETQVVK